MGDADAVRGSVHELQEAMRPRQDSACWHAFLTPGDRYCGDCGGVMLWQCVGVDCHRENRIAARFCRFCGRPRDAK